jgi:hypothetical protein
MADQAVALPFPVIPPEVRTLPSERGVSRYLTAAIDLARQAFPTSALAVSLGEDGDQRA